MCKKKLSCGFVLSGLLVLFTLARVQTKVLVLSLATSHALNVDKLSKETFVCSSSYRQSRRRVSKIQFSSSQCFGWLTQSSVNLFRTWRNFQTIRCWTSTSMHDSHSITNTQTLNRFTATNCWARSHMLRWNFVFIVIVVYRVIKLATLKKCQRPIITNRVGKAKKSSSCLVNWNFKWHKIGF